ncbi:hypothetical protein O181_023311 [Austropuccinia psidii MF-1]|uniref:Reverse transcriptase Ty1/copia-type domain-containing protein n=1 Tax=Austropuccinia psidii MF-1 TaxID=1389203 RepID=A0A9Q3GXI7_9BASI|nr:hypothetical protein [Austropuccinia psidii MF-1]
MNNLHLGEFQMSEIAEEKAATIGHLLVTYDIQIPNPLKHTLSSPFASDWCDAAMTELNNFSKFEIWEPVIPFKGMKVLGGKWVFNIKQKVDGTIERLNAQYVARGFTQQPGIDSFNFYEPTASLSSLCLLLEMKVRQNFIMVGFDVSEAYLYSPIQEDVYVQAPIELQPELNGKVMKLNKS